MTTEYILYILLLVIIFLLSLIFLVKCKGKKQQSHPSPPSLPSLPIVGSLPFLRGFNNISVFFAEKSQELGPIFTFRVGSKLVLTLNNKEVIEEALIHHQKSFSARPELFMQKIANPNTKGLGFRDTTDDWKRIHRNCLIVLKEFGFGDKSIMEEKILKEVEAMVDYGRKTGGKAFDPKELFYLVTSNIIMNILFGSRRDYDLGMSELTFAIDKYVHLINMVFDVAPFLKYVPPFSSMISRMKSYSSKIREIVEKEIDESLQSNEESFVSEFIRKEGRHYDREDLCFVLRDLIAGGSDTTSSTMRWAMIALVNNPEVQKKLQKDVDSVIPRDRFPTLQDQARLPYVEATIHELQRWRTLAPLSIAHSTKEDVVLKDFFIPAHTLVLPNLYAVHNDVSVWKDPDVFRPERFMDKENKVFGLDRVIPFSLGRRSCTGETLARAELFLILTSFVQRFTVLPPEGQDKICDKLLLPADLVIVAQPFSIRLQER